MQKYWPKFILSLSFIVAISFQLEAADLNDDVAIIIGNKAYQDQDIPEVSFAHNDAKAMHQFVQDVLKIRDENVIYIEDATQAQMESAFGRAGNYRGKAFQYVKPEVSNLYVFYSGHGIPGQIDKKSYLLPVDAEIETAEINGFPLDVLYENLSRVEAKSVSIFLDACFSGNSHGGPLITQASGAQIVSPSVETSPSSSFNVLTAATNDQLASWDEESQHGLFTEYLMRALYGDADFDNDGDIDLSEIEKFLKQDMRYKARRTFNREQIPTLMGDGRKVMVAAVDGSFVKRPVIGLVDKEELNEPELIGIDQNFFALKNANVRALPDVGSERIDRLSKGEEVFVTDKVKGKPWYMIELDEGEIGYVYKSLLGEYEPEPDKDIEALKERLARLEQENQMNKKTSSSSSPENITINQNDIIGPQPNWSFDDDPYEKIESRLKKMGALLAKQSFIKRTNDGQGKTALNYNWIKVDAARCNLSASISFYHDNKLSRNGSNLAINIHDRQISFSFYRELGERKNRILKVRDTNDQLLMETKVFRLKPFTFLNNKDRRIFIKIADELKRLCPPQRNASIRESYNEPRFGERTFPRQKQQPQFRRPPPPPPRR